MELPQLTKQVGLSVRMHRLKLASLTPKINQMSHSYDGKTPLAYFTHVIDLGGIQSQSLQRVILNDSYVELGGTGHEYYGLPVLGDFEGFAWIKH